MIKNNIKLIPFLLGCSYASATADESYTNTLQSCLLFAS